MIYSSRKMLRWLGRTLILSYDHHPPGKPGNILPSMISFIITIRTWEHHARREGRTSKLATFRQFIGWCHQIYESSSHLVKPHI